MSPMSGRGPSKKRPRGSKRGPEPIASVLLRASGGESRDGSPLPPRAWHDAVGDRISRRTRPMRLERGVLTVRAATAAQRRRLTALRADGTIGDDAFQRLEQELDLAELDLQQVLRTE